VAVPKRSEPLVRVPPKDIEGRGGVITVTTVQTKELQVLRETLKYPRIGMLGVISRYVGR